MRIIVKDSYEQWKYLNKDRSLLELVILTICSCVIILLFKVFILKPIKIYFANRPSKVVTTVKKVEKTKNINHEKQEVTPCKQEYTPNSDNTYKIEHQNTYEERLLARKKAKLQKQHEKNIAKQLKENQKAELKYLKKKDKEYQKQEKKRIKQEKKIQKRLAKEQKKQLRNDEVNNNEEHFIDFTTKTAKEEEF